MPTTAEMYAEAQRFSAGIDHALESLREHVEKSAAAERDYRKEKAKAWARAKTMDMLAKEKEAWVDAETADLRYDRDLADGLRQGALEAVRSRRAQLSKVQTFANVERAEMELARTGPEMAA